MITSQIRTDLRTFVAIIAALTVIGIIFIYSSSSIFALEKHGAPYYFVFKQLAGVALGMIGLVAARLVPLSFIKRNIPLIFLGSFVLTAITLIPGLSTRIHGSSRWLNLAGFSFQPSELLKFALIMYVAFLLDKKEKQNGTFIQKFLPVFIILGVSCILLLKQPDFGLTVTLATTVLTMIFIMQFNIKYLLIMLAALIPAAVGLVLLKPYRLQRILTFLNPWADPQGSGFQIIQSLIAIGSGGFWGLGITQSKQKFFYLPMQHTDFIFSIIAEETGFIGSSLLIFLYILVLYFGIRMAWQLNDTFSIFTTLGFVILVSLQSAINIAVATGLAPTKGIGLPFVSYGNTSLVCYLTMVGLIMNLVHSNKH